ncbi:hypothetical protein TWF173_011464 [Orbilia oligospora]|nr:hypothetical protein TWF173_011464 [Orbilia oligospora]
MVEGFDGECTGGGKGLFAEGYHTLSQLICPDQLHLEAIIFQYLDGFLLATSQAFRRKLRDPFGALPRQYNATQRSRYPKVWTASAIRDYRYPSFDALVYDPASAMASPGFMLQAAKITIDNLTRRDHEAVKCEDVDIAIDAIAIEESGKFV